MSTDKRSTSEIKNLILGNGNLPTFVKNIPKSELPEPQEVITKLYNLFHMKVNRIKDLYGLTDEQFYDMFKA